MIRSGSVSLNAFRQIHKCDKELVNHFKEKGITATESPHLREHSIEVQVPFLQFIRKEFTFAAIGIGHDADIEKISKAVSEVNDAIIIVSSDFTHYGFNYGYIPFSANIKNNLEKLDKDAIELILKHDAEGFIKYVNKTGITICGYYPILTFLKLIKKPEGRLLKYYTSGDVLGNFRNSVSYASIIF